jgi:hypothetical protein
LLRSGADLQLRVDADGLHLNHNALLLKGLKTVRFEADVVQARKERRHVIQAAAVGRGCG